jgi:hypothetical protein
MSSTDHERRDGTDDEPTELDAIDSIETYESGGGIVFYDVRNPLAWVKTTYSVSLPDQV